MAKRKKPAADKRGKGATNGMAGKRAKGVAGRKCQQWYLAHGPEHMSLFCPDLPYPFDSEAAARACWFRHKRRLMATCPPGDRPYGFFRFELGVEWGENPFDNLQLLLDRNLIDEAEAILIEQSNLMLAPDQSPERSSRFGQETGAVSSGALSSTIRERRFNFERHARVFEVAAAFHRRRNREILEQKYSAFAVECRACIAGLTTQWLDDLAKLE